MKKTLYALLHLLMIAVSISCCIAALYHAVLLVWFLLLDNDPLFYFHFTWAVMCWITVGWLDQVVDWAALKAGRAV